MGYNEIVERHAPILGLKNLVTGEPCKPFVYMDYVEDGMWVHYATYCENIRKLKRALWLAREWRAWSEGQFWFVLESDKPRDIYHLSCTNRIHRTPNEWMTYWQKVEQLCRKKAKEYK